MIDTGTAPYAAFVLRVTLGILFLIHAGLKVFGFTPAGTAQFFGSIGLPTGLAYLVIAWEILGGAALVAGVCTRIVALVLIPILVGAILTVHGASGFFFNNPNGGWEYPAFWTIALVVQALMGDGAFAWTSTPASHPQAATAARWLIGSGAAPGGRSVSFHWITGFKAAPAQSARPGSGSAAARPRPWCWIGTWLVAPPLKPVHRMKWILAFA
jgi:putative oxidoreductase